MEVENTLVQPSIRNPISLVSPIDQDQNFECLAKKWTCSRCGRLLGIIHLFLGVILLLFDMFTFTISNTCFAISAAILYVICAILCFIAIRRVDPCTQLLLMGFSAVALLISCAIFLESAITLNNTCRTDHCDEQKHIIHSILVIISLSESLICISTLFVCFRSLRGAVAVDKAQSPYSTLIIGDYTLLHRPAKTFHPRSYQLRRISEQSF